LPNEDVLLSQAVEEFGVTDWHRIAAAVPGRNPRQCRDRWLNYLSPDVGNGPWTSEDDQLLMRRYEEFGPAWRHIATFFDHRTEINVKNRWMLLQRKVRKHVALAIGRGARSIPLPQPTPAGWKFTRPQPSQQP
jgi:hypothetical protein